jgi:hypothetical protein
VSAGEGGPAWALGVRTRTSDRLLGCRATSMARKAQQPEILSAIRYAAQRHGIPATCAGRVQKELPVVSDATPCDGAGDRVRTVRVSVARRGYKRSEVTAFFDEAVAALDRGIRPAPPLRRFKRSFNASTVRESTNLSAPCAVCRRRREYQPSSPRLRRTPASRGILRTTQRRGRDHHSPASRSSACSLLPAHA